MIDVVLSSCVAPVAQTLYMDERCRKELVLDAVVAVADCRFGRGFRVGYGGLRGEGDGFRVMVRGLRVEG